MTKKISKETFQEWRKPPQGFFSFIEFVQPRIVSPGGKLVPFQFEDFQREALEGALQTDENENFYYNTVILSLPRRHSKTTMAALLALWRFCCLESENVKVLANSEKQTRSVQYNLLKGLILNSSFLREWVGTSNVKGGEIILPSLNNRIEAVCANSASLYGQRISLGWCSEVHAAASTEPMQVLGSSMGDVENGMLLIDSTTDPIDGPLHQLEMTNDPGIYVYRREYNSLKEAKEKSPPWIKRSWLDSRKKQLPAPDFASQHLNKRSQSSNHLFDTEKLKQCRAKYNNGISLDSFRDMVDHRKIATGGGLDRATAFSVHGDRTIWSTIAKVARSDGEHEIYVLNQEQITASLDRSIKKAIQKDQEQYGLANLCLESYNTQDLHHWCIENGYPAEFVYPDSTKQMRGFTQLVELVNDNRLFFPKELKDLYDEMRLFHYEYNKNGTISFGTRKRKDDRVYSLLWAIYSLRQTETIIYELDSITCNSISKHAPYCFLRGGDLILHCAEKCPAYLKTKQMYDQYKATNVESELTLQQFYHRLVKVTGSKQYKAM